MKPNLKTPAGRRSLLGQPLDKVLDTTSKNGYGCHVIHDDLKSRKVRQRELFVHVEDGIVTRVH